MVERKVIKDSITMRQLCSNPVFLAQIFFTLLMTITAFTATVARLWPPFCTYNHWLTFVNLGVISSCIFVEIASIFTWIIFDNNSWIYYITVYFTHGTLILLTGAMFFTNYAKNCDNQGSWPCCDRNNECSRNKTSCTITAAEASVEGSFLISACGYLAIAVALIFLREKFAT